jgi:hypothetical protein
MTSPQMLRFIRYLPLAAPDSEALWKKLIARPMEHSLPSGLAPTRPGSYPLLQILSKVCLLKRLSPPPPPPQVMIRHSKEGMAHIPKPKWRKTLLEMNSTEKTSYNAIVALAQSNLVTTGHPSPPSLDLTLCEGNDYLLPGGRHLDSLLNPRNR